MKDCGEEIGPEGNWEGRIGFAEADGGWVYSVGRRGIGTCG